MMDEIGVIVLVWTVMWFLSLEVQLPERHEQNMVGGVKFINPNNAEEARELYNKVYNQRMKDFSTAIRTPNGPFGYKYRPEQIAERDAKDAVKRYREEGNP